jgi:hypothetical protein
MCGAVENEDDMTRTTNAKTTTSAPAKTPALAGASSALTCRKTPATRTPRQRPVALADDGEVARTAATDAKPEAAAPKGKIGALVGLLRRDEGAGIDEMMTVTGWQAHSVRGAMSGSIKKVLGLNVVSEKTGAGRRYRIVEGAGA